MPSPLLLPVLTCAVVLLVSGVAKLRDPDAVDTAFVDRLLSKCTDHLSLLAAPATLERVYDFGPEAFDSILDSLRTSIQPSCWATMP